MLLYTPQYPWTVELAFYALGTVVHVHHGTGILYDPHSRSRTPPNRLFIYLTRGALAPMKRILKNWFSRLMTGGAPYFVRWCTFAATLHRLLKTRCRSEFTKPCHSYIELHQFFWQFIKGFSAVASPLTNLTRKGSVIHALDEKCDKVTKILKKDGDRTFFNLGRIWKTFLLPRWFNVDSSRWDTTTVDGKGKERVFT